MNQQWQGARKGRPNTAMKLSRAYVLKGGIQLGAWPTTDDVQLPLALRLVTRAAYGRRR